MSALLPILEQKLAEPKTHKLLTAGRWERVLLRYPLSALWLRLFAKNRVVQNTTAWGEPFATRGCLPGLYACGFLVDSDEINLTLFLADRLKSDDIFFDVGANFGFYSRLAARAIGSTTEAPRIHAFEPTPTTYAVTKINADGYGIRANNVALSDHEGTGTITLVENATGSSSLHPEFVAKMGMKSSGTAEVQITTLDAYCARENVAPTVMKIDAEGSEYEVILGGLATITASKPLILIEFCPIEWGDGNYRALEELSKLGYQISVVSEGGTLVPRELTYFLKVTEVCILACTPTA